MAPGFREPFFFKLDVPVCRALAGLDESGKCAGDFE